MAEANHKGKGIINQSEEEQQQQIWSWGAGTDGQLGTGRLEDEHLPQLLHLPSLSSCGPISMLACGGAHVVALTSGGKALTWGRGTSGQLGHGEIANCSIPKLLTCLQSYYINHVSAGWNHTGFVTENGCLFTCGDGSFGQLGHGDNRSHCSPVKVPYFVNKHVEQIACGMRHSLVLLTDCEGDQVYAFGFGKRGQLGISMERIKSVNIPSRTCGLENIKIISISANGDHSAALSADGQLYTWGRGIGVTSDAHCPQRLPSSLQFIQAVLGWNHALVLSGDEEAYMLGGTRHGMLSDPEKMDASKHLSDFRTAVLQKVPVLHGEKVAQIAAGAEHSAIATEGGVIKTWGWGEHGQLGVGDTCDQSSPRTVGINNKFPAKEATVRVFCGSGFTYAIKTPLSPSQS